jgi:hypothetical protein
MDHGVELMADFYAPQINAPPDMLAAYVRGRMAPGMIQGQQQELQAGQLNLDQLRQTMALKQQENAALMPLLRQYSSLLTGQGQPQGAPQQATPAAQAGTMPAGAQSAPSSGGGITNGPQGAVQAPQQPTDPLSQLGDPGRIEAERGRLTEAMAALGFKGPQEAMHTSAQIQAEQDKHAKYARMTAWQNDQDVTGQAFLHTLATDPQADQVMRNNPKAMQMWPQVALQLGLDARDMSAHNVQKAGALLYNQRATWAGVDPIPLPLERAKGEGGYPYLVDQQGKPTAIPGQTTPAEAQRLGMERDRLEMAKRISEGFSGKAGELLAAFTEKGVTLPAGMRSKEQQIATLKGLIDRNPDKTPDEIAGLVAEGKINLAGLMKETTVAGGISGKIKYAENELSGSIPLALEASRAVDRGKFVPLNRLLQMGNASISDPDLLNLKIKTQSVLNAYDMLAARGGTDVGKREAQHALLTSAQSPEAYETALKAFEQEAQVAHAAADKSLNRAPAAQKQPTSAGTHGPTVTTKSGKTAYWVGPGPNDYSYTKPQ